MGKSESDFGKTVILAGKRGTGKSATGNSIIGANVFDLMNKSWGSTVTAQMHTTVLPDGQILNVIDTHGLFDSLVETKTIRKVKSGIHAVIVVVSLRNGLLMDELSTIVSLKQFFGGKISDYMILVFTWGDVLGEMPLDTYLARNSSKQWEKIIMLCGGRRVLFDNVTKDKVKKSRQLEELLRLVDTVVENNDGVPYTNELFVDSPDVSGSGLNKAFEEQMNGFLEKIESKLRETALMLEKQLAEERIARMEAEAKTREAQMQLSNEMSRMMLDLERARKDAETAQKLNKENEQWHERFFEMHRETTLRLEKQLEYEKTSRLHAEAKAQAAPLKSNDEIINLREDLKRAQKLRDAHKEPMEEMCQKQMGESTIAGERTIVLVGKTGNGKSATGNSITGAQVFDEMPSSAGVTATCQLHKTVVHNDQILNVIDTPGLFDTSVESEIIRDEIAKCIKLANNTIHAFLFVLSVGTRFSQEEVLVTECLKQFFGEKICDYMIVVFSHGDALGKMSLADYLGRNCAESLSKFLEMCGNRYVLFDNTTKDEMVKSRQRKELLRLVDVVVVNNRGVPYSNELFDDVSENGVKFSKAYEELLLGKIESMLQETTMWMEKQLADEQVTRKQSEAVVLEVLLKSAEVNRLERGVQKKLKIARIEMEMLIRSWREMESKRRESTMRLEKQLEVEKVARMQAEADMIKLKDEISKARDDLERALRESRVSNEFVMKMIQEKNDEEENQQTTNNCPISEITSVVELKLPEMTPALQNQLEEKVARMQAEDKEAQEPPRRSNDDACTEENHEQILKTIGLCLQVFHQFGGLLLDGEERKN